MTNARSFGLSDSNEGHPRHSERLKKWSGSPIVSVPALGSTLFHQIYIFSEDQSFPSCYHFDMLSKKGIFSDTPGFPASTRQAEVQRDVPLGPLPKVCGSLRRRNGNLETSAPPWSWSRSASTLAERLLCLRRRLLLGGHCVPPKLDLLKGDFTDLDMEGFHFWWTVLLGRRVRAYSSPNSRSVCAAGAGKAAGWCRAPPHAELPAPAGRE